MRHVFLLGAPRSGTTFLATAISQHPDLAYWREPRLVWKYGNDSRSDLLTADDASPEARAYIRDAVDVFAREQGKQIYFEKQPAHALRLDFVDAVFPEAKFIHIIRNGYDATASIYEKWTSKRVQINPRRVRKRLQEAHIRQVPVYARKFLALLANRMRRDPGAVRGVWGPELPGIHAMMRELRISEIAALQWRACVERACARGRVLPSDRYLEIRFEELSADTVDKLVDFMELDRSTAGPVREYFVDHVAKPAAGRAAARLPESERAKVDQWIRPTNAWLGYSVPEGFVTTARTGPGVAELQE